MISFLTKWIFKNNEKQSETKDKKYLKDLKFY